jgi:Nucleoside-diphosphate-sugar epimerases
MQTILITGGNGFLGSNIVKSLMGKYKIIVFEKNTNSLVRLQDIIRHVIIYDADNDDIEQIFVNHCIDIIIHTATIYGRNQESMDAILATNLVLPQKLLALGIKYEVNTFINTDTVLDKFVSDYALTKSQLKDWLFMYSDKIKIINLQLEHFYGGGGSMDNFISLMIVKMLKNENEIALTEGKQLRDFVYFEDVVRAYSIIIDNINNIQDSYNTFQVASGEIVSIRELVETIKRLTKSESILNFGALPYRSNELTHAETDSIGLKNLGWESKVNLEQGLQKTIDYIKNNMKL